ncbi:SIR2 family protein [Frigoribacterium sp. R86507]|uniref:SIR2 family protein n=1 Tax=Frigoribacterium sp. R86507 TaxID=3093850 RepID=UPI0037C69CEA
MKKVVVLGAGFSRAISERMPLMVDLRDQFESRLHLRDTVFEPFGDDVEAWLAYLASDQPWLSDSENQGNRALFSKAIDVLYDVIIKAQEHADQTQPSWLDRMSWQWSHENVTVLTFNYDTLLESAFTRVGWAHTASAFYAAPLTERHPIGSSGFLSEAPPRRRVPTVLKLHGSVNWWHGGSNAPLTEQMVYNPRPHARTRSEFLFADLQPFLVPPTSIKNSYYGRSGLVTQWRLAAQALRAADQVDIIGYSFPASDLPTRTFLSSTIRPDARLRVIDPFPRDGAAKSAMPGREVGLVHASAQVFAEKHAGTRVSAWYSQQDDGQYLLQIEENGALRTSLIPNTPQPDEELRRRLVDDYGPQEYTSTGGRGPSHAWSSTVEVFLPSDDECE